MGKPLDNRQRVKNPRKRDRYDPAVKSVPAPAPRHPKQRREQLQRLKDVSRGGKHG